MSVSTPTPARDPFTTTPTEHGMCEPTDRALDYADRHHSACCRDCRESSYWSPGGVELGASQMWCRLFDRVTTASEDCPLLRLDYSAPAEPADDVPSRGLGAR